MKKPARIFLCRTKILYKICVQGKIKKKKKADTHDEFETKQ